jgi:hypothetical protein
MAQAIDAQTKMPTSAAMRLIMIFSMQEFDDGRKASKVPSIGLSARARACAKQTTYYFSGMCHRVLLHSGAAKWTLQNTFNRWMNRKMERSIDGPVLECESDSAGPYT